MAKLIFDYSKDETEYSDGEIENELYEIVQDEDKLKKAAEQDTRWPVIYHLSPLRHNILNWYPFEPGSSVLEVGAGCGAVTGLLCEKCGRVTAVELTKRRARINYERNKKFGNLDIYAGDIFQISFEEKFDYITLIGVLEYAAYLSGEKNPYVWMIKRLKGYLKPGGRILIAIENRLGLKYFSGACEDHTGIIFDGVNGYSEDSKVRTFSKDELKNLLKEAEIEAFKFYYPFPDYKFPKVILTDESIRNHYPKVDLRAIDGVRQEIFDEKKVMNDFTKEGVLDVFANSFLIETGAPSDISMAVINAGRKKQFAQMTLTKTFGGANHFYKKPLTALAENHIRRMTDYSQTRETLNGFELAKCRMQEDGSAEFEYISYPNLMDELESAKKLGKDQRFSDLIERFYQFLFSDTAAAENEDNPEFEKVFGTEKCEEPMHYLSPCNIDASFDNIFVRRDQMIMADYEWTFDFPIPAEYVFWRAVYSCELIRKDPKAYLDILNRYRLADKVDTFLKWEEHFSKEYAGYSEISCRASATYSLDINQFKLKRSVASLYFDCGSGFSESCKRENLIFPTFSSHTVTFDLNGVEDIRKLRFDPYESEFGECRILSAESNLGPVAIHSSNGFNIGNLDIFLTKDPQYAIEGNLSGMTWIKITYEVKQPKEEDLSVFTQKINGSMDALAQQNQMLADELNSIRQSKSWKITEPLRKFKKSF